MKLFATRHSHAELYVHATWAIKGRRPVLDSTILARLAEQARSTALQLGAVVLAFGGIRDHVHVIMRYRPDLAVSDLVRTIKAAATRVLRKEFKLIEFEWQTGYGAFSVSPADIDRVIAYISNQRRHHADGTVWVEMEPSDWAPPRADPARACRSVDPSPDRADPAREHSG